MNPPPSQVITADVLEELIFSLAWAGHSAYHSSNVNDILVTAFPEHDWKTVIKRFLQDRDSLPGPGSPK